MNTSKLGPVTGSTMLGQVKIAPAPPTFEPISDLFESVLSAKPEYLLGVSEGSVSLRNWYLRKNAQYVRVALAPVIEPKIAGHVAVRLNGALPNGDLLESMGGDRLSWELSMIAVRPSVRGIGIATKMIHHACQDFSQPLWCSVHENNEGHQLLRKLGWKETISFYWPNDPKRGVIMVSNKVGSA